MSGQPVFFHISVNATRENHGGWGDTQYAEGLGRALGRLKGCDWTLLFRGEMPEKRDGLNVLIRIMGPHLEEPVSGMLNMIWMISPPYSVPRPMLERYQVRFFASPVLAGAYTLQGCATRFLPQVTEVGHFHPSRRLQDAPDVPLLFVGGLAERADRKIVFNAIELGFQPQIWGPGWEGAVPQGIWHGPRLGYAELAQAYASARIILNSHMQQMAQLGFMSNRSFDALSSGAFVVSDPVNGFLAPDLPELAQVHDMDELRRTLTDLLARPALTMEERTALHERVLARHSFDNAAKVFHETALGLPSPRSAPVRWQSAGLTGATPGLSDPAGSAMTIVEAMGTAADEILALADHIATPGRTALSPASAASEEGVIHALMIDLREMQQIAQQDSLPPGDPRPEAIASAARRVQEALSDRQSPLRFRAVPAAMDYLLTRIRDNRPLWAHSPQGFGRDMGKTSVRLWGRRNPPAPEREIGVFLHLYHDDLAPVFATRFQAIAVPYRLYVSTDTEQKAERIRAALPMAQIRIVPNRGRDIFPKLYGFGDVYAAHDIVLHLHGKKSLHTGQLDAWLDHILECLLGSETEVNRILSFFESIPSLGVITPVIFRKLLGAAHWGDNLQIARELAWRMGMTAPLPSDNDLRFPVGSMFWARTAAIQPLLDLRLRISHFPPEEGQVDGTLAHALERMLGVVPITGGYKVVPVSGEKARLHVKYQMRFSSNGELRKMLENETAPPAD